MRRRVFVGGAFAGASLTGAYAAPPKAKSGAIPMKEYGKTGVKVSIIAQGGAMEAFESAKKTGKCRFIGFTGHFNPETHAAMLKAYPKWDSVLMPVHAADHAYLSFEKTALPVAVEMGIGIQAIKVFCKAFLLRALNPQECLRYTLSVPVDVAICGAGTTGQMEDNVRVAQSFKPFSQEELADVRKRAIVGQGVYTGTTMEYWKMQTAGG